MIYLDNSATTLIKPPQVAQAVYDAINTMGNSGRGAYNSSISSSMVLYETRELIAEMFNLHYPEQVAFTLNATEALNTAINGLISYNDHIITTELEHNSVLRPLYRLEEKGTELTIIKANDWGNINYIDIEKAIKYIASENKNYIVVSSKSMIKKIDIDDICYIEVSSHILKIVTTNEEILIRDRIKKYDDILKDYCFARCDNSYLVNLRYCTNVDLKNSTVSIKNIVLPISRAKKKSFLEALTKYIGDAI